MEHAGGRDDSGASSSTCRRREEHILTERSNAVLMPTDVSSRVGGFDRFAGFAAHLASRAPFFAFCLLLVVLWLAQGLVLIVSRGSISPFLRSEYQLEINTTTTIVTFLMVALLQNSQTPQRPCDPAQTQRDRRRPRRSDGTDSRRDARVEARGGHERAPRGDRARGAGGHVGRKAETVTDTALPYRLSSPSAVRKEPMPSAPRASRAPRGTEARSQARAPMRTGGR
jgi:Low affinity iron permease